VAEPDEIVIVSGAGKGGMSVDPPAGRRSTPRAMRGTVPIDIDEI